MVERGVSEEEMTITLEEQNFVAGHSGRKVKEKVFSYDKTWLGERYPEKKVKVIYVEEDNSLVVLTVIASYGKWS
ncbi:MAG: hypothetical protein ACE5JO_09780 [Candidatus Binatia bacterium]